MSVRKITNHLEEEPMNEPLRTYTTDSYFKKDDALRGVVYQRVEVYLKADVDKLVAQRDADVAALREGIRKRLDNAQASLSEFPYKDWPDAKVAAFILGLRGILNDPHPGTALLEELAASRCETQVWVEQARVFQDKATQLEQQLAAAQGRVEELEGRRGFTNESWK